MKRLIPITAIGVVAAIALTGCGPDIEKNATYEEPQDLAQALNAVADLDCEEDPDKYTDTRSELSWMQFGCGPHGVGALFATNTQRDEVVSKHLDRGDAEERGRLVGSNWAYFGSLGEVDALHAELGGRIIDAEPEPAEATVTARPTPTVEPVSITIECSDPDGNETGQFSSFEEAWSALDEAERANCDGTFGMDDSNEAVAAYAFSDTELQALEVAAYDDQRSLRFLYGQCASSYMGDYEEDLPWSSRQVAEKRGGLVLCPDHPELAEVEERMAAGLEVEAATERGERFYSGDYKVGEDVPAGTYVTESEDSFDGCYWERLDSAGNIIDNNFMSSGFRAEVTIRASDYSFSSDGCGEWVKQ